MRTTVTIDDDLAMRLERERAERHETFKEYLNEVIRIGLAAINNPRCTSSTKPFHTKRLQLGQRLIDNMDNIAEVLAIAEGEDYR